MAEEENAATEEKGGGASWMIVLLVTILALGAGAGGGAFFMMGQSGAASTPVEEEVDEDPKEPGAEFQERLVTLDPFIVNISGETSPRFLKLKVELEADSPETKMELDARRPQLRDTTLLLLASRRLPEVSELEGRALLKDDLRDRMNELLSKGEVSSVLFTEFVVQ